MILMTVLAALVGAAAIAAPGAEPRSAAAEPLSAALAEARAGLLAPGRSSALLNSSQERDTLLELLRDRDPAVREAAVRALRKYVQGYSDVRRRLLDVVRERGEEVAVRREAERTLSRATGYSEVRDLLLEQAKRADHPSLREMAAKALYTAAFQTSEAREELLDLARRAPDQGLRAAAVWGLFLAAGDSRVRDALLDIARRAPEAALRVEAIKSLYGAMGHSDVREAVLDMARGRRGEPAPLRRPAILALSAASTSQARDALADLARREADPELRRAAVRAMGGPSDELARYFHLLRHGPNWEVIDPLDEE